MRNLNHRRHRRARRRIYMLTLLTIPALFWSCVFAALAGAGPMEHFIESAPDAVQTLIIVACPLLACALGLRVIKGEREADSSGQLSGHLTFVAGLALFVFAVLATLRAG